LHEAVGHGLEGDFNLKGASPLVVVFGETGSSQGFTVIDDGTMRSPWIISVDD